MFFIYIIRVFNLIGFSCVFFIYERVYILRKKFLNEKKKISNYMNFFFYVCV